MEILSTVRHLDGQKSLYVLQKMWKKVHGGMVVQTEIDYVESRMASRTEILIALHPVCKQQGKQHHWNSSFFSKRLMKGGVFKPVAVLRL